jgi:hypothetical protein
MAIIFMMDIPGSREQMADQPLIQVPQVAARAVMAASVPTLILHRDHSPEAMVDMVGTAEREASRGKTANAVRMVTPGLAFLSTWEHWAEIMETSERTVMLVRR